MSKLLTIFLLLYGICQYTASLGSDITLTLSDSNGAENSNQNGYEKIIPADVDDVYHHGNLTTTAQFMSALSPFQDPSTIDHHVDTEGFNLMTYKSAGREKRAALVSGSDGFFVLRGKAIALPCWRAGPFPFDQKHKDTKYIWRDVKNNALANSRYRVDKQGSLHIFSTESSDTGKYSCQLKGTKKTTAYYKGIKLTNIIPLTVYTVPVMEIDINFFFRVASCSAKAKKIELTKKVLEVVKAKHSSVKITSKCTPGINPNGQNDQFLVTSTLGMPSNYKPILCHPMCMEKRMKNYLKLRARFLHFRAKRKLKIIKQNDYFKKFCAGGTWFYKKRMCVPCKAGTYSKNKSLKCSPCPKHTYQGQMEMKKCNKCPKGKTTQKKGSTSVSQCLGKDEVVLRVTVNTVKVEHYVAIGVVPVVIILVVFLVCVIKNRKQNEQKKELRLDQNVEVNRYPRDGYESDMGRTTEMETTDYNATSGSDLEVDQVRRHSIMSKRNANNSHKMPTTPSTCSESLADATNANFNQMESFCGDTMPKVGTSPRANQQKSKEIISNSKHGVKSKLADRLSVADVPGNPCLVPGSQALFSETKMISMHGWQHQFK